LYKVPHRPGREGEKFYIHKTKNHGKQFYKLRFGAEWAKFEGVDKDYIAGALRDEEIKHDILFFFCNPRIKSFRKMEKIMLS